mgnify:CR=1 FL=1
MAELAARGFYFGVDTWLRLHRWLAMQAGKEAELTDDKIKFALSALLCRTDEEQALFAEVFDQYFTKEIKEKTAPEGPVATPKTEELPAPEPLLPPSPSPLPTPDPGAGKVATYRKGPIRIELRFPDSGLRAWNHEAMDKAMQPLREKELTDTLDWDIPQSIRLTIRSGGIPQFAFQRRKQAPAYLVLIEQRSARDHLAGLYREMALEMNQRDLDADYYFFDHSPHLVWKERNIPHRRIPIERLAGEYAGARLLIAGPAAPLLALPEMRPSNLAIELREAWDRMALLCTDPVPAWGDAELALCQMFPVVPATAEGLAALLPQWDSQQSFTPHFWMLKSPEPPLPDLKFRGRSLPPDYMTKLRRYLGTGGFRWLCATAYYPELYFELTALFNDEAIPPQADLSEWEQNRTWWTALYRLCRLPWFRNGHLPTLLREALRVQLPEADAQQVRAQLLDVLRLPENQPEQDSYAAVGTAFTLAWLEAEEAGGWIEDYLPSEAGISLADVEDAIGRKTWQRQMQERSEQYTGSMPPETETPPEAVEFEYNQSYQTNYTPPETPFYETPQSSPETPPPDERLADYVERVRKARNFGEAIEVYHNMQSEEVRPDLAFFHQLLAKANDPEAAHHALELMRSMDIRPDETAYRALAQTAANLDEAMKYFEEMRSEGIQPTRQIVAVLLDKAADFRQASSLLEYLGSSGGFRPDLETYTLLMKKAETEAEAAAVHRQMRANNIRPDVKAYTTWLSKADSFEEASRIFDEMKRDSVQPDPPAYTTLFGKARNFDQARNTYENMRRDGIKPGRGNFTQIMRQARTESDANWVEEQMRMEGIGEGTIKRARDEFENTRAGQTPETPAPPHEKIAATRSTIAEHLDFFRTFNLGKTPSADQTNDTLRSLDSTLVSLLELFGKNTHPELDKMIGELRPEIQIALQLQEPYWRSREHIRLMANMETLLGKIAEYLDKILLMRPA